MPYLMGGYPDLERSHEIARAYVGAGADLVELGVPFSDPLADGPVIHAAGVSALRGGATLERVLDVAVEIGGDVPVVMMCYSNLLFSRGLERSARALAAAGASGLIVPDLPLEEAPAVLQACEACGLALVPLVAPTTPDDRLAEIGARARGFLYAVSLTGTTGERTGLKEGLEAVLARTKPRTSVPVAVGFGIGTPEQAGAAADAGADGVIIGSRLVRAAGEGSAAEVKELVGRFSEALHE
jgi:tryptophan synthase alpha chain